MISIQAKGMISLYIFSMLRYHQAAKEGNRLVLKQATRRDSCGRDDLGQTPLHIAAYYGQLESMVILLSRG